ncbi:hypothetical protein C8J56DRAFT_1063238 [Mycena floridula]|nr:hypothetical protein C8J56DRAFT_1063238 [Mycena floridula]
MNTVVLADPYVDTFKTLVARQTPPSISSSDAGACKSKCSVLDKTSSCTDVSCYCTQSVVNGMASCLSCAIAEDKSLNVTKEQAVVDDFVTGCGDLGYKLSTASVKNSVGRAAAVATGALTVSAAMIAGALLA